MRLRLTAAQHAELHPYLFDLPERIAFLFLRLPPGGTALGEDAHVGEIRLLEPGDYLHRDQHYVELAEHVRPAVIRAAHQHGYAVVEAHAHDWPGPETRFSPTDLDGLRQFGPHMTWRLPGRPYTALVFGRESFDALQWHPNGSVTSIDTLVTSGAPTAPTGISLGRLATVPSWRTR